MSADAWVDTKAGSLPTRSWLTLLQALFFGLAYFAAAELCEWLCSGPMHITTFWLPAGLFVGALLRITPRRWPLFVAAGAVANIVFNAVELRHPIPISLVLAAANVVEAVTGAGLLHRFWFRGRTASFATLGDVLAVSLIAGLAAPLLGTTPHAGVVAGNFGTAGFQSWAIMWSIHAVGVLLVAPIVLVLPPLDQLRSVWRDQPLARQVEAAAMLGVVGACTVFFFFIADPPGLPVEALALSILLWPALRWGPLTVAAAVAIMALVATHSTAIGHGPFADPRLSTASAVALLQAFLMVATVSSHILAAVTGERQSALTRLTSFNAELEALVAARTSELRESEERSRQQLAELEAIYATAPVGLAVIGADCRFLRLNERLAEINGLPVAAHLGRTVREVLPRFGDCFEEIMRRVIETGEPVLDFEAEGETEAQPGVSRAWVEQWLPRKDAAGRVTSINFVVEEVTERKAAEAVLRRLNETLEQRVSERTAALEAMSQERARLASVAENSPDFIGISDLDMRVIYVNPTGRRLVGIESSEVPRRTQLEYFVPEERARVEQEVYPSALECGHWVGELTFQHFRTGERIPVLYDVFRVDAIADGKPSHYATVTRDLRERKQSEERLRQAQKMEAVGQLTGGIAHDFNNLLTVIMGNLERLRGRLADQPRLGRMVEVMQQAAERGERLTGQLLAFSRRQTLRPETLDLNALFRAFEPMMRQAVGDSVRVEAHLAPGLWPCTIDAAQLETVLLNLAVNARDAMPEGGRLIVETRNVERDDRLGARIADASPGPYLILAVSDTGTGMPPEVIARAFEPFYTTKEVGKGSGLGLSQVYGFVEQSGGHVTIDSAVGQGTTVRVYLPPAMGAVATPSHTHPLHEPSSARGSERVLLVEDDAYVLRATTDIMTDLGYEVRAAAGPMEALDLLRGGEPIDLLFSDVVMPNMSGTRLAEEACRLRPGLKVLLTSGYSRESLSPQTAPAGSFPLLSKPYKPSTLGAKIRAILDAQ